MGLEKRDELNRLIGASDMISLLLEEMEEWLEEAQDESKQETLENVVGHLAAMQQEYRRPGSHGKNMTEISDVLFCGIPEVARSCGNGN